ncbi:hypothetical protein GCM10027568_11120 [Humibacter soli]
MTPKTTLDSLPDDPWETRLSKTVFRTIARYKEEMRLSTPELAARVSAVLQPDEIKPTTLNNMLAGKRKAITLPEVFAFAKALGVPPAALVVPLRGEEQVEMFPGEHFAAEEALDLLRGTYVRTEVEADAGGPLEVGAGWFAVQMLDQYAKVSRAETLLRNEFSVVATRALEPEKYTPETVQQSGLERLKEAVRDYRNTRDEAVRLGAELAPVSADLAWLLEVRSDEISPQSAGEAWLTVYERDAEGYWTTRERAGGKA